MESNIQALLESTKFPTLNASDSAAMSMMLKNTEKEHDRLISEGTLTGDVQGFTPILMPMVRRVYPNLIANEILGVQPMSMPTGFIYALTNRYLGDGTAAGSAAPRAGQIVVTAVADLAIGTVLTTGAVSGTVLYSEGFNALVELAGGQFVAGDVVAEDIGEGATTTTVDGTFTNEASFGKVLKNYSGPVATAAAELLSTNMKELGFSIDRKQVEAKSRALKGQYSVEMYQDLKSQHGLLADEEIMSLMSYEMQAEIDRECVDFVNNTATQLVDTNFSAVTTDGSGRWEIEKYRTEAIRISVESAQIGIDTKRGQGNVLIVSPKVGTMLEQVGTFKAAESKSNVAAPVSGGVAGTYDGRFKVIIDQYAEGDYATVLYKGADRRDALGFFAPYVPMSFTKVTHPDSGQPAVIAKTRYALDTIPGSESATSTDRAAQYARSFGINFTNTVIGGARQA